MTTKKNRATVMNPREVRRQITKQQTQAQTITGDVVPGRYPDLNSPEDSPESPENPENPEG